MGMFGSARRSMFGGNRSNFMGSGLVAGDGMGPNIDLTGIDQSRLPMPTDSPRMPGVLAAPQLQTMAMPMLPQTGIQSAPQRGGGVNFRNIAGVLGDALAQASGGQARFLPQMMHDREQQRQLQLQQQQQAEQRAYEQAIWQQRQDYQRAHETSQFEDNGGNRWQVGADGRATLLFRDPNPRFEYREVLDGSGNKVLRAVPIPNGVPSTAQPGMAYDQISGLGGTAQPTTTATGPAVGTVHNGFRFRGGNPNDRNSWEPVGGQTPPASGNFR